MTRLATHLLIFSLFISINFSCKQSLDIAPSDFTTPEFYYNTEDELNKGLLAVYNVLSASSLYGCFTNTMLLYLNQTDEMFMYTSGASHPLNFDYNSSHAIPQSVYYALYRGIERANHLIANINKPTMDKARRDVIEGEARFIRAVFYFDLVRHFGAVVLRDKPTASVEDIHYARTPAPEVYDFIIKEMEAAEAKVSPITAFNHSGRVTKSAVQAMLARVCLHKAGFPINDHSKYADALKWSTKVIESGLHSLNPDYSQVFINAIQDKYDTKESLWEIEFYSTGASDINARYGGWGAIYNGIRQTNPQLGYSAGSCGVQATLYNKYENADLRRDWAISPYYWQGDNSAVKVPWTAAQIYDRRVAKWRRDFELPKERILNYTSTNCIVLRYSDVLLMAAEAENELNGPTDKAVGYVNEVRRRGYGNGRILKSITVTNGGTGYLATNTNVTISANNGVNSAGLDPASAKAVVTGGKITGITLSTLGTYYSAPPVITITGAGTGATATSTLAPVTDADLKPAQIAGKQQLLKAIQDERAMELCFEGWRRTDLVRWGIYISTMRDQAEDITANAPATWKKIATAGNNISERDNYIPIPLQELQLNKLLTQTPGW